MNHDFIAAGAVLDKYRFKINATSKLPAPCVYDNQTASCDNGAVPLFQLYITERMNSSVMVSTRWLMVDVDQFRSFLHIYMNSLYSPELSEECQVALWEL